MQLKRGGLYIALSAELTGGELLKMRSFVFICTPSRLADYICTRILKAEAELPQALETSVSHQVILYGVAPLLLLPLYSHMKAEYDTRDYGGNCSSGSSCSSGGGCGGGGCGGCGGS